MKQAAAVFRKQFNWYPVSVDSAVSLTFKPVKLHIFI